jgi:hypothetical protein|tara:strand:+ start:28440 stop:28715 length:276 start_codon:yes stop_codon:yes gene_type:complete
MIRNMEGDLVQVLWWDTLECPNGWHEKEDIKDYKPSLIESIGWIITDSGDYITLIADRATEEGDETIGRCQVIPQGCIKSINRMFIERPVA